MERLCFHTVRFYGQKFWKKWRAKNPKRGEDKVREKFVCPSNFGQKTKFVYIKLGEKVTSNINSERDIYGTR